MYIIHQKSMAWRFMLPAFVLMLIRPIGVYCASLDDASSAADEHYRQVIASPLRTSVDRNADSARKPLAFLRFTGVQPGMLAMDISAGGGYTTQLLALAVGNSGKVWAQNPGVRPALEKRLAAHPQSNIVPVTRSFEDPIPDGIPKLDLITIIMNYHDIAYMPVDREKMDKRLYEALKHGGHLVVLDHSAREGEGTSVAKSLHRIEEKVVLEEFRQTGFRLEQEGDFMRNPEDPRDQPFFNMKIPTDKFALRFVKP